jgi:hypothetical protein
MRSLREEAIKDREGINSSDGRFGNGVLQEQIAGDSTMEMGLMDAGGGVRDFEDEKKDNGFSPEPQDPSKAMAMPESMIEVSGKSAMAGILPVRVNVPSVGNTSIFTKTLPETNTALALPLWHWANWIETSLWYLGAVLALGALWLFRGILFGWIKRVAPYGKPLLKLAGPASKPAGTLFAASVLVLACAKTHPLIFFVALLIYSAAAGRWILSLIRPAEGEKP